jgi:hypothetical protein
MREGKNLPGKRLLPPDSRSRGGSTSVHKQFIAFRRQISHRLPTKAPDHLIVERT